MKKNKQDYFNDCRTIQRITQHKRFVPYGTHPNPSLTLRTSFMLKTLYAIGGSSSATKQKTQTIGRRI